MTVKEAVSVLKRAKKIDLTWNGEAIHFDKDNALMVEAYSMYIVDEILAVEEEYYEVNIAMIPMKVGVA